MYKGLDTARFDNLLVAEKVLSQVICLPIYPDLSHEDVLKVISIIERTF